MDQVILEDRVDHTLSEFLEETGKEVDCLPFFVDEAEAARLYREAVRDVKVPPDCDSRTIFLIFFNFELATEKPEHFGAL